MTTFRAFVSRQPILVAGFRLALFAVLALCLPTSCRKSEADINCIPVSQTQPLTEAAPPKTCTMTVKTYLAGTYSPYDMQSVVLEGYRPDDVVRPQIVWEYGPDGQIKTIKKSPSDIDQYVYDTDGYLTAINQLNNPGRADQFIGSVKTPTFVNGRLTKLTTKGQYGSTIVETFEYDTDGYLTRYTNTSPDLCVRTYLFSKGKKTAYIWQDSHGETQTETYVNDKLVCNTCDYDAQSRITKINTYANGKLVSYTTNEYAAGNPAKGKTGYRAFKGYPEELLTWKTFDMESKVTSYNIRSTGTAVKSLEWAYSYTKNSNGLPTKVSGIGHSYDAAGSVTSTTTTTYGYQYADCQ